MGMSEHEESDRYAAIVNCVIDELDASGVIDAEIVRTSAEAMLLRDGHPNAQRIVARAWNDDQFRERLLADGNAVREVLGFDMTDGFLPDLVLRVVENTPSEHNIIVCTLCSCYPLALLGPQPRWYKSAEYRSRMVVEPRAVLREFGLKVPDGVTVRVWDSTAETRYLVLPERPADTQGWDVERLSRLVSRDAMIGVARATDPATLVASGAVD